MSRVISAVLTIVLLAIPLGAQEAASAEYKVKAAFLLNFFRYVEWPPSAPGEGPMYICVAGRDPFGPLLAETMKGQTLNGRPLGARVILEPEANCHIVFVPDGAATAAYLRRARGTPTLTVGEQPGFIERGGMIAFFRNGENVRFTINPAAAERAGLRISARLLELARIADDKGRVR